MKTIRVVAAVIKDNNKIFATQRGYGDFKGGWEFPGGKIEEGETPLEAAKRELFEETGAVDFELEPLCDYSIDGTLNGYHYKGNGQVYLAMVHRLEEIPPYSEMGEIGLFDSLPEELTCPILREYFPIAEERLRSKTAVKENL